MSIIRRREDKWRLSFEVIGILLLMYMSQQNVVLHRENKFLNAENTLFREQVVLFGMRSNFWKGIQDLRSSMDWSEWTARKMTRRFNKTAREDNADIMGNPR